MDHAPRPDEPHARGEIIEFDQALLDARPPQELDQLMIEASLLALAFAPDGRAAQVQALAHELTSGARDLEYGRARARLLAAALRRLARSEGPGAFPRRARDS